MAKACKIIIPDINYKEGTNLFKINTTPDLPKYTSGFINDVNGWAGGSKAENVGQVSELIKQFRENNPTGGLNEWIEFHQILAGYNIEVLKGLGKSKRFETVQMSGIEQGVRDIMQKMEEVKANINQLTEDKVRAWLKNLVYEKTFCGLEAQEFILKDIALKNDKDWLLGSVEDEQKGIDGFIIDSKNSLFYPLQIKSKSFNNEHKQERFICPIITYELKKEGILYNVPQNAFVEPEQDNDCWQEIRSRIENRFRNKRIGEV